MRTNRQNQIDRALAEVLRSTGTYMLPEPALKTEIGIRVHPRPTDSEVVESIRHFDTQGRLTSVQGETGPKYRLNDAGQAWAAENL